MSELLGNFGLEDFLTPNRLLSLVRAGVVIVVGLVLAGFVNRGTRRLLSDHVTAQQAMLIRRLGLTIIFLIVVTSALHQLGFQLGVLLGAAGILSIAIGFASQTSASNLISGLFLIAERSFVVGDLLNIDGTVGQVLSIDLLSVKLRTFDNLMMRVPNEQMIKTTVLNLTRFPIRRLDVQVSVAYKEDTERVREVLIDVADKNPICLDEPAPLFIYRGFGDSGLELQFSVWARRENFLPLRNSIHEEIKAAFDEHGIEIPFPHRTLYTGTVTDPFPIRVVESDQ